MKKILFSMATILAANFSFGQITLIHTSNENEKLSSFSKGTETFYVGKNINENKLYIYDANFVLSKTVNIPMPNNYVSSKFGYSNEIFDYSISKHIFNADDKIEFIVLVRNINAQHSKLLLINEDGLLIKDFNTNLTYSGYGYEVFHDNVNNNNKLFIHSSNNQSPSQVTEVYSLPTSALTSKEIQNGNKLSAFPIPTNKILNIINPENGANRIEIFDASGKIVLNKNFSNSENKISVDVESLPKGTYFYKVGEFSSKFIKN